jgi:alpha-L-fucosidase 2
VSHLIAELSFDNLLSYSKAGIAGAENCIFVVDGNLGGAAVVCEMLVRSSSEGEIDLLPALPACWPAGSVRGMRVRGNMEIDLEWADGRVKSATLKPFSAAKVVVYHAEYSVSLSLAAMEVVQVGPNLEVISRV